MGLSRLTSRVATALFIAEKNSESLCQLTSVFASIPTRLLTSVSVSPKLIVSRFWRLISASGRAGWVAWDWLAFDEEHLHF
jgi:hypothetical protein